MPLLGPPASAAGSSKLQPISSEPEQSRTDVVGGEASGPSVPIGDQHDKGFISSMLENKFVISGREEANTQADGFT
jgi:hypothetical protein